MAISVDLWRKLEVIYMRTICQHYSQYIYYFLGPMQILQLITIAQSQTFNQT